MFSALGVASEVGCLASHGFLERACPFSNTVFLFSLLCLSLGLLCCWCLVAAESTGWRLRGVHSREGFTFCPLASASFFLFLSRCILQSPLESHLDVTV